MVWKGCFQPTGSCSKAVCVTASLLPRNSTWDYWVSAESEIWFVWLGCAGKLIFKCCFSFESVITLVLLQGLPGNGMLIVVNESVRLSKLCRAELTEHNSFTMSPDCALLTLVSLAFKSNGTKSSPSDLRAFFSIQDSSKFLFLSHLHGIFGRGQSQGSALASIFGTGRGHWWPRGYGILNKEKRVWIWSWRSIFLCSLIRGVAVSKGVLGCFIPMSFFFSLTTLVPIAWVRFSLIFTLGNSGPIFYVISLQSINIVL